MPVLPIISGKELYDLVLKFGCVHVRTTKSSHFIVENPDNGRRSPIPIHGNKDIGKGLLAKIIVKDLGIDINNFLEFIK